MLNDIKYGDFQRWLDDATEGLDSFEQERVRWELESHLVEVVKQQLETIPEDVVSRKAFYAALLASIQGTSEDTSRYLKSLIDERRKIDREVRVTLKFANSVHLRALVRWIETATRGLCDEAEQRVSAEIQAHAADAVQEALDRGQSESEAFKAVMAGLGNPDKAGKAFRRVYLTQQDERTLNRLESKESSKAKLKENVLWAALFLLFAFFVCTFNEVSLSARLTEIGVFLVFTLLVFTRPWLTRRLMERMRARTALAFQLVSDVLFIVFLFVVHKDTPALNIVLCVYLLSQRHCFRLFVKLGKKQPGSPTNLGES